MAWVRRVLVAAATLAAAGVLLWASYQVASGKTTPPQYTRASAERALKSLRAAHGDRWAPNASRNAERAMRAAQAEFRRQEASTFFFTRNFDEARRMYAAAEDVALQAVRVARDERERARLAAERAIEQAGEEVEIADGVAETVHIGAYERMLLQKSRLAIAEARILCDAEQFAVAGQRAELAALQAGRVTDRAARVAARFTDPGSLRRWRRMIEETVDWSRQGNRTAVVVAKESHRMTLYDSGRAVRTYPVDLGYNSVRDKQHAGDNATPEGRYLITAKKGHGSSRYYKALLLNYPNDEDRAQFQRLRTNGDLPRWASPGGLIEIHGEGGRGKDWTNGCVALSNHDMDELFTRVGVGTPVTIVGADGAGGAFSGVARIRNITGRARPDS